MKNASISFKALFAMACTIYCTDAFSTPLGSFFFDSGGTLVNRPIDVKNLERANARVFHPCSDDANKVCVSYDLIVPKGYDASSLVTMLRTSLLLWSRDGLKLSLGKITEEMGPFLPMPTNILDYRDFQLSLVPLDESFVSSGAPLRTLFFAKRKSGEKLSEIVFSRVYLKSSLSKNLMAAAIHYAIGQSLGLGSSMGITSLMSENLSLKERPAVEDLEAMRYLYDAVKSGGEISGRVLDGTNGNPLSGVHVLALPTKSAKLFIETLNRNLVEGTTVTDFSGRFLLPQLSSGEFYLAIEPAPETLGRFDPWMKSLFIKRDFEMEFYDGGGRESNWEPAFSFSPQGLDYAARLRIEAGSEIKDLEMFTNLPVNSGEQLSSKGVPQEMSASSYPDKSKSFSAEIFQSEKAEASSGGGGCIIGPSRSERALLFILILLVGGLFAYRRQSLKAK